MREGGQTQLLFDEVPEGTHYKKGAWAWVSFKEADKYIEQGIAREWNLDEKVNDLPEDLPGRERFLKAGYKDLSVVKNIDWQSVYGIGERTEKELEVYFGGERDSG